MRKSLFLLFAIVSVAGMIAFSGCNTDVKTYTVTFDANGGEGTMDTQLFTEDYEKALSANKFTREGFSFAGWNTMRDGSGTSYTDQQKNEARRTACNHAQRSRIHRPWIATRKHVGNLQHRRRCPRSCRKLLRMGRNSAKTDLYHRKLPVYTHCCRR